MNAPFSLKPRPEGTTPHPKQGNAKDQKGEGHVGGKDRPEGCQEKPPCCKVGGCMANSKHRVALLPVWCGLCLSGSKTKAKWSRCLGHCPLVKTCLGLPSIPRPYSRYSPLHPPSTVYLKNNPQTLQQKSLSEVASPFLVHIP